MNKYSEAKLIKEWKKTQIKDLGYISYELKELVKPSALIFLEGNLGSGKTTFAKSFLSSLDKNNPMLNKDSITSPTYSLITEIGDNLHADLYRIEEASELTQLELPLYLEDKNYCLIEWGYKFFDVLNREIPEHFKLFKMDISMSGDGHSDESQAFRDFKLYQINSIN